MIMSYIVMAVASCARVVHSDRTLEPDPRAIFRDLSRLNRCGRCLPAQQNVRSHFKPRCGTRWHELWVEGALGRR
jgi:hypothetical protein